MGELFLLFNDSMCGCFGPVAIVSQREMKCVNHNVLQHCNIHHIGNLIENVNGRLLCVFASLQCFLCVLQVSFATNDYNRSTFELKTHTQKHKTKHIEIHRTRETHRKKCIDFFCWTDDSNGGGFIYRKRVHTNTFRFINQAWDR